MSSRAQGSRVRDHVDPGPIESFYGWVPALQKRIHAFPLAGMTSQKFQRIPQTYRLTAELQTAAAYSPCMSALVTAQLQDPRGAG